MDIQLASGTILRNVHDSSQCEGRGCSIHHPSPHHMSTWPQVWRDFHGYFERQCPHGIGHPDPDDMAYIRSVGGDARGIHGCDGCCHEETAHWRVLQDELRKTQEMVYGALARASAMVAGVEKWWMVTQWPMEESK